MTVGSTVARAPTSASFCWTLAEVKVIRQEAGRYRECQIV